MALPGSFHKQHCSAVERLGAGGNRPVSGDGRRQQQTSVTSHATPSNACSRHWAIVSVQGGEHDVSEESPEPEDPEDDVSASQDNEFTPTSSNGQDKLKEDLARACRYLYTTMDAYAKTTNKSRDIVNNYFDAEVPPLPFHLDRSLREHMALVRENLVTIYQEPILMHKDLKAQLDPSTFSKIGDASVSVEEEMEVLKEVHQKYRCLPGRMGAPLIAVLLVKSGMMESALPATTSLQDLTVLDLRVEDLLHSGEGVCEALTGGESESDYIRATGLVWETSDVFDRYCYSYIHTINQVCIYMSWVAENLEE
ncbi:uncharacterized protein LOC136768072 [Amia ocellicauda]|uniref:uncharacterized protein LOC136768072 n=1 Tax=Amia ocellicauda TaxID=2972642 RepID=UPI003464976F